MIFDTKKIGEALWEKLVPTVIVLVIITIPVGGYKFYTQNEAYYKAATMINYHQALALEAIAGELGGAKPKTASNNEDTSSQ